MNQISERLKQLRKQKGVSQKKMAEKLDVSVSAYSMYERDMRNPNIKSLIKLSNYFNVSIDYLLAQTDEKEKCDKIKEKLINSDININLLEQIEDQKEIKEILNLIKDLEEEKIANIKKIIELTLNFSK